MREAVKKRGKERPAFYEFGDIVYQRVDCTCGHNNVASNLHKGDVFECRECGKKWKIVERPNHKGKIEVKYPNRT